MNELERINNFTKAYIELVKEHGVDIYPCCCVGIGDARNHPDVTFMFYVCDLTIDGIKYKFKDGEFIKDE